MSEQQFDSEAFIAQHGLQDLADVEINAHGEMYTVQEALNSCPPFAKMITSLAVSLDALPNKEDILKTSIYNLANSAEMPLPEPTKKNL